MMKRVLLSSRVQVIISLVGLMLLSVLLAVILGKRPISSRDTVQIVIAPDVVYALSALGGMVAQSDTEVVIAALFQKETDLTEAQHKVLERNNMSVRFYGYDQSQDLELARADIALDIQALLSSYGDTDVEVVGPSSLPFEYQSAVTRNRDTLMYEVFFDIADTYPKQTVQFAFYEQYPDTETYMKSAVVSLERHLNNTTERLVEKKIVSFPQSIVDRKINILSNFTGASELQSVKAFTESRCGTAPLTACEIIYSLPRFEAEERIL